MSVCQRIRVYVFGLVFAAIAPVAAQETCPGPHQDYRKPTPVWGGFGYQVNACVGDKVEVAATLTVHPSEPWGVIQIPQTLPWHVSLDALPQDQIAYLREHCESDLPCAGHFRITVVTMGYCNPEETGNHDKDCGPNLRPGAWVTGTLDGWR